MDTVLTAPPAEVRLWFSDVPKAGTTSIRVLDSTGEPVSIMVMGAVPDPEDATVQVAELHGVLTAGRYTIAWATVAEDEATANGEIRFTVRVP